MGIKCKLVIILALLVLFFYGGQARAQSPTITSITPTSGPVGIPVTITGQSFGATQGASTVLLNGISATVVAWSDTSIVALVPSGASSGPFSVTVNGQTANSSAFTITPLPSGWSDGDVGSVGIAGSGTYASGMFTVKASGTTISGTADAMHFVYLTLSGDGTIVARVASLQGGSSPQAGVMIRETLNANSTNAYTFYQSSYLHFYDRATTGGSTANQGQSSQNVTLPYWMKMVRSGNSFSGYYSPDGLNWTQLGTSQTITMATNVYIGLAVSGGTNSSLATATFDSVSINSAASPAPAITGISPAAGVIGSQAVISGSGFGASQGSSLVILNGVSATVNSWSTTSISITVPTGATSGPMVVAVAPSMNASNPFPFLIATQPLPSWLDVDIGSVGAPGSATFANGTFTMQSSGRGITGTADGMNYLYQMLSGDGTIVARVVSVQGSNPPQAGVMIRETLNANSTYAFTFYTAPYIYFYTRSTTGANTANQGNTVAVTLPYWVKLVRSGSTFSTYTSLSGIYWKQLASSVTITMAQSVYIGLAVTSQSTSSLDTVTFDNVSISSAASPAPVITGLSATTGPIGSEVLISGSGFGATQNGSVVSLNGASVTVNAWSDTSIVIAIPTGATSGPVVVSVAPSMNDSNPVVFTVTTQPLTAPWLDQDIGPVGAAGSATFANGTFTVQSRGQTVSGSTDSTHFVYQSLAGDGTIMARVASVQGTAGPQAGVMIRETLNANSTNAYTFYTSPYINFYTRSTTGAGTLSQGNTPTVTLPYWVKLVRSGSTFSAYTSLNGMYWTQLGSTATITMAQNVYVGLAVSSGSSSVVGTATFDNVSISSAASPAPIITGLSATTGSIGSQVMISGSGFGASEGGSIVTLNDAPMTINLWSNASIIITIASGATSGPVVVSVAPSMNNSNPVSFTVTTQPLQSPWLDQDIGPVGAAGSATFANGTFTVQSRGQTVSGSTDSTHFVYQSLAGDGTIIARVASVQGTAAPQAGVMIRETLAPNSKHAYVNWQGGYIYFYNRTTTGGGTTSLGNATVSVPYWVKLVRTGSTFRAYTSPDGVNWTQLGSTATITMAQNVYVGLAVSSGSSSVVGTATFDNVSVTVGTTPFVTGVSPLLGGFGTAATITGSNFGATQGNSTVTFNGTLATSITSWSDAQIIAAVPNGATTGPVDVTVNSIQSISNAVFTVINPVISGVTPPGAEILGQVTLNGTGFGANRASSSVQFNGTTANSFLSWSDTSITVQVPSNATTGPVTVTESSVTSNSVSFTVLGTLSVTGISPNVGPVGSSVTITGTGFGSTQSSSTASFDSAAAAVTSWSDTQIVAVVPSEASTGPVSVTVANVTAFGPTFEVSSTLLLTDSLGHQSSYASQIVGGEWRFTNSQGSGCSSCTTRGTISNQYDNLGNVTSTADELGYVTSYTYDSNDNMTSMSQPTVSGGTPTTTYTYNSFGEVLTMTDPLGNVTTNTYDAHGNLTSVTSPAPGGGASASVTQFAYNSLGELTQITDPLGHVTTMTYTPAGLIASITDPQSHVTTYQYDARGNRTAVIDALGNQTTFAYDAGNRLTSITYPGGSTSSFVYDYRGRRISATDQNGKTTSYAYDDADRLMSVTDAAAHVTQYAYDTENNLLSITDANLHTTNFSYDAFGRVTQTVFPSNLFETYAYDADNNLTSKTDRKNQTIQYVYDALNRLTQKSYPDATNANYVYDLVGKVQSVNDPTGTYGFAYDNMGRLTGTTTQYAFLAGTFTNSYTYDVASNRTGFTAPDGSSSTYSYDTLNRLSGLANSWAGSFGFGYDALSRRTQMTRPNGISTNYSYDSLSRLLSVLHQAGASTIDGAVYTVDAAGNRTSKADQLAGVTSNYAYDAIDQLTQVAQGANTTESYSYDPVGNRLSSLGASPYTYNPSNEMVSTPTAMYVYDSNGNMTSKTDSTGTTSYAWDFENRLTQITLPGSGGTVTFKYDPFGRRIYKSSASGTSIFAYDGDNMVEETNATGAVVARYSQGQNIDEPLAMSRSSATSYYEADGLGSVTSLTSAAGALAQTYIFDSFGKLASSTGSLTNPFQYTAREFDEETGLYYYRARYYDPSTGRFLSEDPIGFLGSKDFYKYVANSPPNAIDPTGLTTTVIVVYDPGPFGIGWVGTHSALLVDNGGNPILYDPAGAYSTQHQCGSGNACSDTDADSNKFKDYHEKAGSKVQIFVFDTTREEEKQIAKNIDTHGGASPFFCTVSVIDVLKGVGPFKNLKSTPLPGSLARQLQQLQQGTPKK